MMSRSVLSLVHILALLVLLLSALLGLPAWGGSAVGPAGGNPPLHQEQVAPLTPDQAIAVAVNDLEATTEGYTLQHPQHATIFRPEGIEFAPKRGGPLWRWSILAVTAGEVPVAGVVVGAVPPVSQQRAVVAYERGVLVEQYLPGKAVIEQQFVIARPLPLGGADLVIAGAIQSEGLFEETQTGWRWHTPEGAVYLGDVRVLDATGRELPATMQVSASATRIVVAGVALAEAAYPVTVDPEIGANDVRLSDMGQVDPSYDAQYPAVAYNSTDNEYLVVWSGHDNTGGLVRYEREIFGQRVDAATGAEIGANDFRLSDMGPDGDTNYGADYPAVAYNGADNEYLMVWWGDDDTGPLVDNEWEIFGQRVDAATGVEVGANDFRLSDMGPDGETSYGARRPVVAYNGADHEYLVVWSGEDNTYGLVSGEQEIFGQRVDAAGAEIGANDFRLSDMGGDVDCDALSPAVAHNSANNEYLVVWSGDDNTAPLVDEEFEIFGQRVDAATGAQIGDDLRFSDMGPDGDTTYAALHPAVAYNSADNDYLVIWQGDDDTAPLVDGEYEIFGQRVDAATGAQIGDDLRFSDMGPDGDTSYGAYYPAVAYNSTYNQYLVVWWGDDDTAPLVDNEYEIFGQRLNAATGAEIGANDFRLSDMGPNGETGYGAHLPAVAYNPLPSTGEYLVVWYGDDITSGEYEVYGQRLNATTGAEIGANDFRLSDMGPDGDTDYDAAYPAVAYNSTAGEYLVVWRGDDDTAPLVDEEYEIYGQRVDAATGAEIGANDLRLSDMGPDGDANYKAYAPAVAYASASGEYLVVWSGDDNTPQLVDNEYEIYGQRVDGATGAQIEGDQRLSDMGPDGNPDYDAHFPAVACNPSSLVGEYLVVWEGDDNANGMVDDEVEIFGQRFTSIEPYHTYLPLVVRGHIARTR